MMALAQKILVLLLVPLVECRRQADRWTASDRHIFKDKKEGRAPWLMPVIPALSEAETGRSLEARSLRPALPTLETSSLIFSFETVSL